MTREQQIVRLLEALVAAVNGSPAKEEAPVVEQAHVAAEMGDLEAAIELINKALTAWDERNVCQIYSSLFACRGILTRIVDSNRGESPIGGNGALSSGGTVQQ